jgi:hypothetical protein
MNYCVEYELLSHQLREERMQVQWLKGHCSVMLTKVYRCVPRRRETEIILSTEPMAKEE